MAGCSPPALSWLIASVTVPLSEQGGTGSLLSPLLPVLIFFSPLLLVFGSYFVLLKSLEDFILLIRGVHFQASLC